jgi:magnesium-transporting ATPase (P-type)
VVAQLVNVHMCRSNRTSTFVSACTWNPLIVAGLAVEAALMLLIAYTPAGHAVFGTAPIALDAWWFMLPFAGAMLAAEELRKWVVRSIAR